MLGDAHVARGRSRNQNLSFKVLIYRTVRATANGIHQGMSRKILANDMLTVLTLPLVSKIDPALILFPPLNISTER